VERQVPYPTCLMWPTTLVSIDEPKIYSPKNSFKMFNALNRFISRLDSDSPSHNSTYGAFGFQVLRNKNADLAVEPWFDFIVCINGRLIVC
jgi:hypothetical protein